MNSEKTKTLAAYTLMCLIWGSTWLVIRIGLESITPFVSAGFRFVTAAILIFLITKIKNIKIQTDPKSIKLYLVMAALQFTIPFGLIYWAEQFIPSGLASVLFAVYPFAIAIVSYFLLPNEEIGISKIIGMIISFTGLVLIFSDHFAGELTNFFWGMGAVLLGSVMQAFNGVYLKKHGHHLHPLAMNFIPMLICGISLLIYGYATEDHSLIHFDHKSILSILYLAVFGSIVTFTSFYYLMKRINIILLSLLSFITPVLAVILGTIIYNEEFSTYHFIGSGLVLAGLLFAIFGNLNKNVKPLKEQTNNG